jgi:digeranylgeranylglycerophospholipid reductase
VYDVIVIGGNLSGAYAAINAAQNGVNVALVERHKKPFTPAHCAEAIPDISENLLKLKGIKLSKNVINEMIINVASDKKYNFKLSKNKIFIINRCKLENDLLKKAEEIGIKLFLGTSLKKFIPPNDIVLDNNKKIKGKVIIDASGIVCIVSKFIGVDSKIKPEDIGVCIQSRIKSNFKSKKIFMWFHKPYAPFGYAWLFPLNKNEANVGLGIPGGQKLDLKKLLDDYIKFMLKKDFEITHTFRACEPLCKPLDLLVKDNVMFVGDAARVVDPASGAGIHNAIFSGSLAGIIASRFVKGELKSLDIYQEAMKEKTERIKNTYKRKNKMNTDEKFKKGFKRIFSLLSIINKVFPNFFQGNIAKILKRDEKIIQLYSK